MIKAKSQLRYGKWEIPDQNPEWKVSSRDIVVPPMTALSYNSKQLDIATSCKHHQVKVSPLEETMLAAWIDVNCPYRGLEEILAEPDPDEQTWLKRFTYGPKMRTAPIIHRAFRQDQFKIQDDRIPKDADGKALPSIEILDGKRIYRLPQSNHHQQTQTEGLK